jgi:integrase
MTKPDQPRRQYGTGSIYQRASDGRWVGSLMHGWTANGTRKRITVTCADTPEIQARAEIKRLLRDKKLELDRADAGTSSSRKTVKSWADEWLARTQHQVRPKTWASNRSCINLWVIPTIGHKRLNALTPGDIRSVADAHRAAGNTTTTALRTHVVLTQMLSAALIEGHLVPQRVLLVAAPGKSVSDRDAIPYPEAIALLRAAANHPDASRWVAALLQGMRQGECLGLTWDCVNLDAGTLDVSWQLQALPYISGRSGPLRVPDGYEYRQLSGGLCLVRPKTQTGQRLIPLVPWMATALRSWAEVCPPSPHRLVWPRADGRPQTAKADSAAWKALQVEAGVSSDGRGYYLHEARHTCATLLLVEGTSEKVVTAIMGHSSIVSTAKYQHVNQAMAREALEGIARRLELT